MIKVLQKLFKRSQNQKWIIPRSQNWSKVKNSCIGYDSSVIANSIKSDNGTDLQKTLLPYAIIANIMKIAQEKSGKISVLDFGGSTGGTYFFCREFLPDVKMDWTVIEQESIVRVIKEKKISQEIKFSSEIPKNKKYDVIIISSVLQYLENYTDILRQLLDLDADCIIFDRTLVFASSKSKKDILTIQQNPTAHQKKITYPCWILNKNNLYLQIPKKYVLINEFFSAADKINKIAGVRVDFVGSIWKKI